MRLVNSTAADLIELRGRDAIRAPIWVGFGLLVGPTLLSLLGPAPFTALHLFGTVGLFTIASGLIAFGWPRRRWVHIGTSARTITTSEDSQHSLGPEPTARLLAVPTLGSSGNALYGVGLEQPMGDPVLLIATKNPNDALRDLGALRAKLALRVIGGWGLPGDVTWTDGPAPPAPRKTVAPWDDRAARRPIATALLLGAATIGVAMGAEIKRRLDLGDTPAPLSIGLPVLGIALLLLVTLILMTDQVRMALGANLSCERKVLGFTYARGRVNRSAIRGAYLVSPSGHHVRHLLLDTDDGPVAFPCDDVLGTRVKAAITRGVATGEDH